MKIIISESQLRNIIFEMASPSDEIKGGLWYHGTNEESAKKIIETGYLRPSANVTSKTRKPMAPIFNKTYLTANIDEAVRYALFRTEVEEIPYLISVSGENLKDVQPDEDIIADLLQTDDTIKGFEWLISLAKQIDSKLYRKFLEDGDYVYSVRLAKKIINVLSDKQKIDLINKGMKIAHSGEIPITNVWQLPPLEDRWDSARNRNIDYYINNKYKIF